MIRLSHTPGQDEHQDAARRLLIAEINGLLQEMDHCTIAFVTHMAKVIQEGHLTWKHIFTDNTP